MEGAALNTPPATPPERLDHAVRWLIPPAAREAVVGDLWETYQNPSQYARDALRIVPFVVFSQMRRHFNLPALMLQAIVLYACLGALAAALLLPALMIAEAYQPLTRPSPRRAMREAITLAFAVLIFLQALWGTSGNWKFSTDGIRLGLQLFFVGPCLSPLLCLLRAGLIVGGDRRASLGARQWTAEELAQSHARFIARLRGARFLEAAALAAAAILSWRLLGQNLPGQMLVLFYGAAALFLVVDAPATPATDDFLTVRASYQRDLTRYHQLRRFLWWLWCTPALLALHADAVGIAGSGHPAQAALRGMAAIMLCFFVTALNREGAGWTQEQISALGRMRERLA
jgi:hypothetical protein